jgi:hypothetical protein
MINEAHQAGLRVSIPEYCKVMPNIEDLSEKDLHDETTKDFRRKVMWWVIDRCPRRDIENEPPPPRLSMLRPKPLGPRVLGSATRSDIVKIHRSAERCYSATNAPWRETPHRFCDTTERVFEGRTGLLACPAGGI